MASKINFLAVRRTGKLKLCRVGVVATTVAPALPPASKSYPTTNFPPILGPRINRILHSNLTLSGFGCVTLFTNFYMGNWRQLQQQQQ